MTNDVVSVTATVQAPAESVFNVLADPAQHAAIDGTGWVRESLNGERLHGTGQVFRMAMYHDNHPDGHYEMANKVELFEPPHAIAWQPGQLTTTGELDLGGWIWRYDLTAVNASETEVTLTYDWSAVPQQTRQEIEFPPFGLDHLEGSLRHLAEIVAGGDQPATEAS